MTNYKRRILLIPWTLAILAVLLMLGLVQNDARESPSTRSDGTGRAVFISKGCADCHSVYGYGVGGQRGKGGPDLGERQFYGTYLDLAAMMWNHLPRMFRRMKQEGYEPPELTQEEMGQVISYISSIRYVGQPGSVFTGRKLLKSKQCLSCHKVGGVGEDIGPDFSEKKEYLAPLALVEALWNHGPEMQDLFTEHKIKRPKFKGSNIVDMAAAIRSYMSPTHVPLGSFDLGDPKNGQRLADEKGCMLCHSFRGVGGTLGPDFFEVDLNHSVTEIAGEMWNHGAEMWEAMEREGMAYPVFEQGEMADVIAYLYQLKLVDAPGDREAGWELIRGGECLSCHATQVEEAGLAPDLAELGNLDSPLDMASRMWNHAPAMEERYLEKRVKWPSFTGRDMANLYAYLSSPSRAKGRE